LPSLPEFKGKKKWEKIVKQTKLFLQGMRTTIYRRPRLALQRLPFEAQPENPVDAGAWRWRQRYCRN
jgi:hypothetical protein